LIHLDYRDARPLYSQIVEKFRRQIDAGVLQEGDRMPSVRELAAQLAINPNTIQRAYRELEMLGCILSVAGKGSFVCGAAQPDPQPGWEALDSALIQLQQLGVSREDVVKYICEGGKRHD
jgi:GntR family transcriptional regulator